MVDLGCVRLIYGCCELVRVVLGTHIHIHKKTMRVSG